MPLTEIGKSEGRMGLKGRENQELFDTCQVPYEMPVRHLEADTDRNCIFSNPNVSSKRTGLSVYFIHICILRTWKKPQQVFSKYLLNE